MNYDFCGYVTKNDILCTDGRTIRHGAFKHCDGTRVPLVWNHNHSEASNILGHVDLENRSDGVYGYGEFNNTYNGKYAKEMVQHGDITSLSIFANQLQQVGPNVTHGVIREVSLVLAGANKGAFIDEVFAHSDEDGDCATMLAVNPEDVIELPKEIEHSDKESLGKTLEKEPIVHKESEEDMGDDTIAEVIEGMSDEQKEALYAVVIATLEAAGVEIDENGEMVQSEIEGEDMLRHNLFEGSEDINENTLSHSQMETIIQDAKSRGSLRESVLMHADEYGIEQIDWLFPEYKNLDTPPEFIKRDTGWVSKVMNSVHRTPFSRIKSMFADLREDEARALGYMKGKLKKEEVFSLLKRTTDPQTIYKKQKLDRDDVIDITDFDVVSWIKGEMRIMLDEEIARAILIGDGRLASSDDKIHEDHIRPIWKEAELFTVHATLDVAHNGDEQKRAKDFIKKAIKARKNYKGSGSPSLYTTEDMLSDMLLIEDNNGRMIYESEEKLRGVLRVSEIVTVPVMEEQKNDKTGNVLEGIIVNLADYNVGADQGGSINMFEDFDIDYNQMKYLIETRCSGALIKPFSAIIIESPSGVTSNTPSGGSDDEVQG